MKVTEDNIDVIKEHFSKVFHYVGLELEDEISEIAEDDEEICLDLGSIETNIDISEFLQKTENIESMSYDDYCVRCGRFTQFNIAIEGHFYGLDASYFYEQFNKQGISVSIREEPLLIGLRNIKEDMYDMDYWSPIEEYVALEISYEKEQYKLSAEDEVKLVQRVLFSLNSRYSKTFTLLQLPDHNPMDVYDEEVVESDSEQTDVDIISIESLPHFSPMLQMYINAKEVKDYSLRYLMFYKILEYISPFVAQKLVYEKLNQKLDKLLVSERNSEYLDSLINLTRAYDNSMKDGELAKLVLDECADLVELQDLIPQSIKKRMMTDSNYGKNVRWTYENIKGCEDRMKKTLATYLYSTRNEIVHAKSNYTCTGFECPPNDIPHLDDMLQSLCYTIVYWKERH